MAWGCQEEDERPYSGLHGISSAHSTYPGVYRGQSTYRVSSFIPSKSYVQTQPHDVLSLFQPVGKPAKNRLLSACRAYQSIFCTPARPRQADNACTCMYSVLCMYVLPRRLAGIPAKNRHAFLSANYYSLGVVSQCTPLDQEHVLEHVCFIRGTIP